MKKIALFVSALAVAAVTCIPVAAYASQTTPPATPASAPTPAPSHSGSTAWD